MAKGYLEPLSLIGGRGAREAVSDGHGLKFGDDLAFTAARVFRRDDEGRSDERIVLARSLQGSTEGWIIAALDRLAQPAGPARVMGIVNVTPDSFSDGGRWHGTDAAIAHGIQLASEGADILDVGGESTRPGAAPVSAEEEIKRVVGVVGGLARKGLTVSIDSRNAPTMRAALDAGARIVNDVSALSHDPESLAVVAEAGCDVVLMHSQGDPQTMQDDPRYERACLDIFDYLEARIAACEAAGIGRAQITIDPGVGFGKRAAHSLDVLQHLALLRTLGCPVLVGASRKSFIAHEMGRRDLEPGARLPGSLAAALAAVRRGATVVRVHDVEETVQALKISQAIEASA